ncbi:kinesin-domain-containing protein [Schizophyllum commune H4-8]|uniref:Kinesin-like protein n=1 Tax=Schizophyllum commune (strain H4-8 / FGSC 9210) TaxID=578458 RepID=D8PLY4_SCHCM|nr:kinesin-domain-containing protein [Schizophyllum commune H4-8]KAI5894442.1 kinesin-domain-containing protein [Schizophyllum commune H4-8]
MSDGGDGNIKVVVRCRPLNSRELARGAKPLIRMQGNQTFLDPPEAGSSQDTKRATERKTMAFSFDKSYWSAGPRDEPGYCSQKTLFDDLGRELLDHGFAGFNTCIMAYGQTGSGKSYSMMGYGPDKGIIPQTCMELFERVASRKAADPNIDFTVEVSYIEIYNEKVRDLLNPKNTGNLRVREHPSLGPYVEDLSKLMVNSYEEMMTLMDEGNKARTVAATNMNETSSRSHAVFTLLLTTKRHDVETNMDTEKVSRINLIDLAGSERANSTGATGQRLKEGANINKSLTTLGKVIAALASAGEHAGAPAKKGKKGKAEDFIPYRDSVLTWLLKDSLGGNSKTAMIAAIAPADYEETLSTLRYADQAKKIKNKAVINEDPNAKLVRELKEELEMLRARVQGASSEATFDPTVPPEQQKVTYQTKEGELRTVTKAQLQEQMETSEKLMQSLNETWEEKMERTQAVQKEREQALEELGITVEKNLVGVHTPKKMPHLVNLNEDPLMSECLIYQLKPGQTMVGRLDSEKPAAIRLSGENIMEEHCYFQNDDGKVHLHAMPDSVTFLNGKQIAPGQGYKLRSGYRIILGDNHVFRFNNPEEVRKLRDRAAQKHQLSQSISAADLEAQANGAADGATSVSSNDAVDVDWNFAKREAALARLGLDPALDSLPDEDLNKLFEKIAKVKTMRDHVSKPRPESSMSLSQPDDIWSDPGRPFSSDATDDTSVEVTPSLGSPEVDGNLREAQNHLENRLMTMSPDPEAEDLKVEKDHMEHQLRLVKMQMKRLIDARARGETDTEAMEFEPVIYSARQLRLIRKVLDKWRAHRSFSMAEVVLSNAVLVKEANIISKELGKDVTYNFTISAGGSLAAPASAVDTIAGLDQFGDVSDPRLTSSTQPTVAVKVLDSRHNAIYCWSLDRMQQQIQRMRNLTTYIDRPSYTQHFSSDEPFYDSPPPEYSFIGNALVSLAPLSRRLSSTSVVPIFCRYTSEAIGSCRIDIKLVNVVVSPRYSNGTNGRSSSPVPGTVPPGTKLSFFVTVDNVKGLSSIDFSAVHLQVRLSSFVGPAITAEEVFPSNAIDLDDNSLSDLKFRRSFSIVATSKTLTHLRTGYAPIEFFASVRPTYVERLERWDEMREQRHYPSTSGSATPSSSSDSRSGSGLPLMRRSENDFVVQQQHDVVAWVQVCELAPDGQYAPVPVVAQNALDPGSFCLHQGLQRRIKLSLASNSGQQLPWLEFTKIRVGNVRLLDGRGRVHESTSKALVTLPLLADQHVEFRPDGTGMLVGEALWDSSIHNSTLLNRVTSSSQRILLRLQWSVAIDTCAEPVNFDMDIAITMQTRDARPPSKFLSFLGSSKVLSKTSNLFNVRLSPPLTRSAKDLWRLDTSEKYVRGEETLTTWRPRGISVVEDYYRLVSTERRAADVQAIRVILATLPNRPIQADSLAWRADDLIRKSVELWQRQFGHKGEIVLSQDPRDDDDASQTSKKYDESLDGLKLVSETKLIPRTDGATKKGYLHILTDAVQGQWEKRWFVLRRPYLHIYTSSNELEEVGIVSLSGVNVEADPAKEALLGKPYSFTLFTASNSHALAAPNLKELQSWTSKLDPTRLPS